MDAGSSMSSAAIATISSSIQALGRGFDVTCDVRLLYCKGASGARLVHVDEDHTRDLVVSDSVVLPDVSVDVECSREKPRRESTPVWGFEEMAEFFNKKLGISGSIPLGNFNSMFNFSGCWQTDTTSTRSLALDGYFIPLCRVHLRNMRLILQEHIICRVPQTWDPPALASFIETYGTHVITSVTVGGRDMVYLKQHQSSSLSALDIENYIREIGDQRFQEFESLTSTTSVKEKDVTVIFRRRGGDDLVQSYSMWATTVESSPDIINMTFMPIVFLLEDLPGIKHLEHAVDLYLKYKPPLEDLQYFLDFQISRAWAPVEDTRSGHNRKQPICPALQLSLIGPKLYISTEQISVGRRPVTGFRLCLDGAKCNRLSIHVQHLMSLPKILQPHWDTHMPVGPLRWQGPEEQDTRWFEPIKWKNFSHVCTAPVENTEAYIGDLSGVHIVTGAQLCVWDFGVKSVLHLKLLFSNVPGCTVRRSLWDHNPYTADQLQRDNATCLLREGVHVDEKKIDNSRQVGKLVKIVDMSEMSKGPQDMPGHWLVTGAKLGVEKGKIVIRVKYSLLNY